MFEKTWALPLAARRANNQRSLNPNDLPAHVEWFLAVQPACLLLLHVKPRKTCIIYVIVRKQFLFERK
jgi:hypothetical protein